MKKQNDNYIIVAVADCDDISKKPTLKAYRCPINLQNLDIFPAGSKVAECNPATRRRLILQAKTEYAEAGEI